MKDTDPLLLILTTVVGLALLAVVGRFAVTGELNAGAETLLPVLSTMFGGLVTAIVTSRKKDGDDDGN